MSHICAICTAELQDERWVYSAWTGNRYCMPGEGCFTVDETEKRERSIALKAAVEKVPVEQAENSGTSVGGGFSYKSTKTKSVKTKPNTDQLKPKVLSDLSESFLSTQ